MMTNIAMSFYPFLPTLLILAVSLAAIFWTADRMLLNAVAVSNRLNVPPLIIGALVIGFGTSAPELVISSVAALHGSLEIAIGNAFGSNVANIALVLGAAALVSGISKTSTDILLKLLIVLAATALPGILLLDNRYLDAGDGVILLAALAAAIYLLIKIENNAPHDDEMSRHAARQKYAVTQLIVFTALLLVASYFAVREAVQIAEILGISELTIGLTVIAIGTSLPELAAAVISAYRRQHSLALGGILGSNLFNSLAVIGVPTFIHSEHVPEQALLRDYPIVIGITLLLGVLLLTPPRNTLGRGKGLVLLTCFVLYQTLLYFQAFDTA